MKLEENYKNNVELPELEKRKEELKRKRLYFSSIQHDSIKNHLKWYNSIKENNANKIKRELATKNIE